MSSLQDQLLKAGLADKKKAVKVKTEKRKQAKQARKHKTVSADAAKLAAEQALAEKKAKDQALNAAAKQAAEKKAIQAQIRQLINLNQQPRDKGDIAFNFTQGNLVKRIYVTHTIQQHLSQGKLAIVSLDDQFYVVPTPVADKIAERDTDRVCYRAEIQPSAEAEKSAEDDWYADYEIPDDLMW